jgi:DNA-binding NtrC family response regulator
MEAAVIQDERRRGRRACDPAEHGILCVRIRPGHPAALLDVSADGALIETAHRLLPGTIVVLHLESSAARSASSRRSPTSSPRAHPSIDYPSTARASSTNGNRLLAAALSRDRKRTSMASESNVFAWRAAGTRFGCIPKPTRRETMNSSEISQPGEGRDSVTRQRDRRRGIGDILAGLSRAVADQRDPALMRGMLQQLLAQSLPVRSVHLRTNSARWTPPDEAIESVAIEVPAAGAAGVLEATFEPGCRLGEWDLQLLNAAAHLAALILEIERTHVQLARAPQPAMPRVRRDGAAPLVGSTRAMADLRSRVERVAGTDFTVLLEGESGVGKELVARQIHESSRRRGGPFVAVNCAAIVETLIEAELFGIEDRTATGVRGRRGKFEHADGGTLFLDEVSDLSLPAQAKLLRAIQDLAVERVGGSGTHRVDIRIIAATNRPLAGLVERHMFRTDLFYRLSGVDIRVPSLRERREDIIELARHFLARHRATRSLVLSDAALAALQTYDWPGNVRELERLIERTVALAEGPVIGINDLPSRLRGNVAVVLLPSLEGNDTMRAWGSRYARLMVERCKGNKREASRLLGISPHTLLGYLKFTPGGSSEPEAWPAEEDEGRALLS